ncbi:hypothetical protein PINS_up008395 [Pythium insidiosum]|nr:hypothetical protein PINS_up008395 [Pythium insidiosum]
MGRAAFAYRDLDEELVSFTDDHAYVAHASPPHKQQPLIETTVLKQFVDHQRATRRRKLLGVGVFAALVLVTLLPMLLSMRDSTTDSDNHTLSLSLSAPYKALRARETARASESEPVEEEDLVLQPLAPMGPSVGDPDPHDVDTTQEENEEDLDNVVRADEAGDSIRPLTDETMD